MKEILEKYGSGFTVITPGEISGLALPCQIAVASKNGWQVEEYKDQNGETKYAQVIRFLNKDSDDVLCMKIAYKPEIVNKTTRCDFTEEELFQLKIFIGKYHCILMLHNCGVIDSKQLIAAINVKTQPEKRLSKYRIYAEIYHDWYISQFYVDMPDVSYTQACEKYKSLKTELSLSRDERIPGYYYLKTLEIEKPTITIPHVNGKLKELNEKLKEFQSALQNNTDVVQPADSLIKKDNEFLELLKEFSSQWFIRKDESFDSENNFSAAEINNELKKYGYEIIKKCYDLLNNNSGMANREEMSKLLWETKEIIEDTLRYKIYALQDSQCENKWRLIGFAETLKEAYFYLENNRTTYAKANDSEYRRDRDYKGIVHHMFTDPDDECTQSEFKVEGENLIEYFSYYAEGPLLKFANYVRAEGICCFCKKTFSGHGKTCRPVQYRSSLDFGYKRCCPECEEKYLKQAEKDKEFRERIRMEFLFVRPEYKGDGYGN